MRRLLLQLEDLVNKTGRSFLFAERRPPRPRLRAAIRDLGGWFASSGALWIRCALVFERGATLDPVGLDDGDTEFLASLRIRTNVQLDAPEGAAAAEPAALALEPAWASAVGAALRAAAEAIVSGSGAVALGSPQRGQHCVAWLSALLLLAAGVPELDVVRDSRCSELVAASLAAAKGSTGGSLEAYLEGTLVFGAADQSRLRAALVAPL